MAKIQDSAIATATTGSNERRYCADEKLPTVCPLGGQLPDDGQLRFRPGRPLAAIARSNLLVPVCRSRNVQTRTRAKEQIGARSRRSCQCTDLRYRWRSEALPRRAFHCASLNTRLGNATIPPYRSCGQGSNLECYSQSTRSRRKRGT